MRTFAVTLLAAALLTGMLSVGAVDATASPAVVAAVPLAPEYPGAEAITIGTGSGGAVPAAPFNLPSALVTGSASESAGLRWLGWCYSVGACA
ncbi:hypothetical protein [Nocardia sp. alder85J]|uniref:hypothetical protein n=1 Tax=Nocardia sp. alder85J TaxID=2862949 RepID=UPI001CD2E41B|nr:hypothetical protein [Nocardia sp. alder85J]MCX4095275.1 hypothetical protein [Nocardia sp. alder85J]